MSELFRSCSHKENSTVRFDTEHRMMRLKTYLKGKHSLGRIHKQLSLVEWNDNDNDHQIQRAVRINHWSWLLQVEQVDIVVNLRRWYNRCRFRHPCDLLYLYIDILRFGFHVTTARVERNSVVQLESQVQIALTVTQCSAQIQRLKEQSGVAEWKSDADDWLRRRYLGQI